MTYPASLLKLDDEMVALGRPNPPVVAWLTGKTKGAPPAQHVPNEPETCPCAWCGSRRAWEAKVQAWEQQDPARARRWAELRQSYIAEEERLEQLKWSQDDWNYTLLQRLGAPQRSVDRIRRQLDDRQCFRWAQEWMQDGTRWALLLIGGPGSGKTTAATWAAHQLMMRSFRPHWVNCAAMVDAPMWGAEAELRKARCREAGVLVLDDLAASARERDPKNPPRAWLDWLDDVLGYRHGNNRKTVITSNRPSGWLAGWLGDRLADRLNEGVVHETSEPSMRGGR